MLRSPRLRIGLKAALAAGTAAAAVLAPTTSQAGPAYDASPAVVADAPDIDVAAVLGHLQELQDIADANGGNRGTGQPGYRASLDYVQAQLDAAGYTTQVQSFSTWQGTSYNLIADWPGGDTGNTVMMGAHLDSVSSGAGINDNGTGTAGILETALAFAEANPSPRNHVRFGFWGAEELGLVGSTHYVDSLSSAEVDDLAAYFNFDMIGSPNPGYFVYDDDPNGTDLRDSLTAMFDAEGIDTDYVDVDGRSDHAAFMQRGIPTAGTFTGAEGRKTSAEAEKWGGTAGQAYDPCYHSACDDMDNLDQAALDVNSDVVADALWQWSEHDFGGGGADPEPPTGDNVVANPGFEEGATAWSTSDGVITSSSSRPAHAGSWKAWFNGYGRNHTDTASQDVTVPAGGVLSFWLRVDTREYGGTAYDTFVVQVVAGGVTDTVAEYSNTDAGDYRQESLDLSAYAGQDVTLRFVGDEDAYLQTSFVLDDVVLAGTN